MNSEVVVDLIVDVARAGGEVAHYPNHKQKTTALDVVVDRVVVALVEEFEGHSLRLIMSTNPQGDLDPAKVLEVLGVVFAWVKNQMEKHYARG